MTLLDVERGRGAGLAPRGGASTRAGGGRGGSGARGKGVDSSKGMPTLVAAFLICLVFPISIEISTFNLQPYRILLLGAFFPLAQRLFMDKEKPALLCDWLMVAAVGWAGLAYLRNHGGGGVEPAGMRGIEVMGGWMLGRVGIRNADDMRKMVRMFFIILLCLLPFAIYESVFRRPVLLQMLPNSPRIVWTERWGLRRAQVIFSHPILWGVFAASAIGLVWYLWDRTASVMSRLFRSGLLFAGIFVSLSAGALVAFTIQVGLIAYEIIMKSVPDRWRLFAFGAAGTYIFIDLASNRTPFHLIVDYLTFSTIAAYNRILIFDFGMDNVWRNPIFGLGERNWVRPWWMGNSVDNWWLMNAMQFGLPGFFLLAGAIFVLMRYVAKARLPDPDDWACRAGWYTSMGGLIIAGGTVHYWTALLTLVIFLFGSAGWLAERGREQMLVDGGGGKRGGGASRGRGEGGRAGPSKRDGGGASAGAPSRRGPSSAARGPAEPSARAVAAADKVRAGPPAARAPGGAEAPRGGPAPGRAAPAAGAVRGASSAAARPGGASAQQGSPSPAAARRPTSDAETGPSGTSPAAHGASRRPGPLARPDATASPSSRTGPVRPVRPTRGGPDQDD